MSVAEFSPIRWAGGMLQLLDQTRLPAEEVWLGCRVVEEVADAIRCLAVRGAPAIGVAAAYGLVLAAQGARERADLERRVKTAARLLAATRPTAVNLRWALDRGLVVLAAQPANSSAKAVIGVLESWAGELHQADISANRRIGEHGAALFAADRPLRVLTHCNAGALATAGYGTALGVIRSAWESGRIAEVFVDETRPLLQGSRLTAWELKRLGIPHHLIPDSAAGSLLARGAVDRIVVGADRIARNGDTANKVGTYPLAVLARWHDVPFYIAAPLATFDRSTPDGAGIPIEERSAAEVTSFAGIATAPPDTRVLNPAFDVTPAELITAIVTEVGVLQAPYEQSIAQAFKKA